MTVEITLNPRLWKRDLFQGLKGATRNWKRLLGASIIGLFTFFLSVFSANPGYSVQMLISGIEYWQIAFLTRFTGMYMNTGLTGIALTLIFSILVGVTITNTIVQLRMNKISFDSLGAIPGLLAGGCASCGVGVLSLLGLGGVLASMPFQGNILRFGAVLLLMVLIIRTGNPDMCDL